MADDVLSHLLKGGSREPGEKDEITDIGGYPVRIRVRKNRGKLMREVLILNPADNTKELWRGRNKSDAETWIRANPWEHSRVVLLRGAEGVVVCRIDNPFHCSSA